jgi:hypothetical protein
MEDPDAKSGVDVEGYGWMTLDKKRNGKSQVAARP